MQPAQPTSDYYAFLNAYLNVINADIFSLSLCLISNSRRWKKMEILNDDSTAWEHQRNFQQDKIHDPLLEVLFRA